jgi:hypothetical protein
MLSTETIQTAVLNRFGGRFVLVLNATGATLPPNS